ncbi:MAG TPA: lipid-A-disaccharide synthase N-terminal domain-containing protein [Thermoanaerobaculia bacterium]|nr:lipid-A-disaccharide synthase N-terminal domain-containing protein [Thermoanaerobaculia bacterium]
MTVTVERLWVGLGLIGQLLFSARFIIQWIASERKKRSVIPVSFWYFSLGGSALLLAYAIYRKDPVFILGQSAGAVVYVRNLRLIRSARHLEAGTDPGGDS